MQKGKDNSQDAGKDEPYRVRLPGFISDEQVGLGDVVKQITYADQGMLRRAYANSYLRNEGIPRPKVLIRKTAD